MNRSSVKKRILFLSVFFVFFSARGFAVTETIVPLEGTDSNPSSVQGNPQTVSSHAPRKPGRWERWGDSLQETFSAPFKKLTMDPQAKLLDKIRGKRGKISKLLSKQRTASSMQRWSLSQEIEQLQREIRGFEEELSRLQRN